MRFWKYALSAAGAALVLAGCGGGDGDIPSKASNTFLTDVTTVLNLPASGAGGSVVTSTVSFANSSSAAGTATAVVGNVLLSNGEIKTFTVPDLAPGGSSIQSFTTTLPNNTATPTLRGTATVATANPETNTSNNSATSTLVVLYADPGVAVNPMLAGVAGSTVTATITLSNNGSTTVTFTPLVVVNGLTQTLAQASLAPGQTRTTTVQIPVTLSGATVTAIVGSPSVADTNAVNNSDTKIKAVFFTSMVNFGDSLSDVGSYKVGTVAALSGGQYTVNGPNALNWTAIIAKAYGLAAPCAAQTGLDGLASQGFAVAVTNITNCFSYAQGGSRVTSQPGPGNKLLGGSNAVLGQLTVPVLAQMQAHLVKNGGAYSGQELVTVMAGGNDLFIQSGSLPQAIAARVAAGQTLADAQTAAVTAAVTEMGKAGAELAGYVKAHVLAKGAKNVVVVNLPNVSKTPYALAQDVATQGLVNLMATTFNDQLKTGLTGVPIVLVDAYTESTAQANNPASYGLTNVTGRACSVNNPLGGTSLVCNASNLNPGDVSRYQYADDVHPSPYGYELLGKFVQSEMIKAGLQ
jgi:outer membrane lipase/esterase